MKSMAIYNNKGGCGKSTSVINLAYEFSLQNSSVLVIDADGQSNTSRFFVDSERMKDGLAEVLTNVAASAASAVRCETRFENIDVITSTSAMNDILPHFAELPEKTQIEIAENLVRDTEKPWFFKKYDYVLVDLPPTMNLLTKRIIGACDYVFVPIELSTFSIQGIPKVTSAIAECDANFGGVYINKFDRKNHADAGLKELLEEQLGDKALKTVIPYSNVIKNSISYKLTAAEYMGWTTPAKSFAALADEIKARCGK